MLATSIAMTSSLPGSIQTDEQARELASGISSNDSVSTLVLEGCALSENGANHLAAGLQAVRLEVHRWSPPSWVCSRMLVRMQQRYCIHSNGCTTSASSRGGSPFAPIFAGMRSHTNSTRPSPGAHRDAPLTAPRPIHGRPSLPTRTVG